MSMNHLLNEGDVVIQPSPDGPRVSIQSTSPLTWPSTPSRSVRHWSVAVLVSSLLWLTPTATHAASFSASEIIAATNVARKAQGLPALTTQSQLNSAAGAKAADMFTRQYFNHYSPTKQAPWVWVKGAGYQYTEAGENLAVDFVSAQDVVDAWMRSSTHRANIVSKKFNDIGVAVVDGTYQGQATTFVVQFFGSRAAAPVAVKTTTPSATPVVTAPKKVAALPSPAPVVNIPVAVPVSAPVIPQPKAIHSLVEARGVDKPVLQLTPVDPAAEYIGRAPAVQGATDEVTMTSTGSTLTISTLPTLVGVTLAAYTALLVGLASLWKKPTIAEPEMPLAVA